MQQSEFQLKQLYFYLTGGCNLCCRHCWIEPKFQNRDVSYPSVSVKLFRYIIDQAQSLGLTGVKLTGGEPLLHLEINDILDEIHIRGLRLTVETNGLLCTKDIARKIRRCKNAFVSVSLDGSDAETHEWIRGVKGSFDKAIEGMRILIKEGLKPQVIMTVMRRNRDQIEGVVRIAESLGCSSVKINIVQPISKGKTMHRTGEALEIEDLIDLGRWIEEDLTSRARIKIFYGHPPAFRMLSRIFSKKERSGRCGIFGIMGVLADGSYALCGIGESESDMIFGHAEKDQLRDVWENTTVLKELRRKLPLSLEGVCRECLMKHACFGHCVAQNYYNEKNLFAPYWYCKEAYSRGLFPKSRLVSSEPRELAAA